jgi:flagellar basal-body rod modification protein FlgD
MTSGITGTSSTADITKGTITSGTTSRGSATLDKDAFLKLLVAQLKYQDPSKPVDSSQFMAQTAQLTMVEKIEELATGQSRTNAMALIGRTVTYSVDADGQPTNAADARSTASGVVTSATVLGSTPTIRVGDKDVPLSSVREVTTKAA